MGGGGASGRGGGRWAACAYRAALASGTEKKCFPPLCVSFPAPSSERGRKAHEAARACGRQRAGPRHVGWAQPARALRERERSPRTWAGAPGRPPCGLAEGSERLACGPCPAPLHAGTQPQAPRHPRQPLPAASSAALEAKSPSLGKEDRQVTGTGSGRRDVPGSRWGRRRPCPAALTQLALPHHTSSPPGPRGAVWTAQPGRSQQGARPLWGA